MDSIREPFTHRIQNYEYDEAVQLALDSNNDQPGYDEASAMAAVDAMLVEESGSISTVLARLRGGQ